MSSGAPLPARVSFELPAWVEPEVEAFGPLPDRAARVALANRLAARNFREGSGGPFAAVVYDLDADRVLSAGVNLVLATQLSSLHAEVTALTLAQTALGDWDLSGARVELAVNWRPCAMCYGATIWSGVRELAIAGSGPECEQLTGFDEGPMRDDWAEKMRDRGVEVHDDVARDAAIAVFRAYRDSDALVYNPARG
ncbi:MAG: nucleoside deaminase [Pseudoclavibacter sp.]